MSISRKDWLGHTLNLKKVYLDERFMEYSFAELDAIKNRIRDPAKRCSVQSKGEVGQQELFLAHQPSTDLWTDERLTRTRGAVR